MTIAEVIGIATAIISALVATVGVVWKRGEDNAKKITEVYEGRLADKDKEIERVWQLASELRRESPLDREVINSLGGTVQQLRETVLTAMRGRR